MFFSSCKVGNVALPVSANSAIGKVSQYITLSSNALSNSQETARRKKTAISNVPNVMSS